MRFSAFYIVVLVCLVSFSGVSSLFASDIGESLSNSPAVSFFNPSGMNGFIVYDVEPSEKSGALTYGTTSFDLSSRLGLPVTVEVEVEGLTLSEGSYDLYKFLRNREDGYLEIFSIQQALAYGPQTSLSSLNPGATDITMVIASANYQATERFTATFSTGLAQAVKESDGSTSPFGYELDIAGLYELAPGLTFSVGAGYATNTDYLRDFDAAGENEKIWSLNSKLRQRF
jgi:hypothetical protein